MSFTTKEEAKPANPAATEHKFYFKSDGMMYMLDASGMETQMAATNGNPSAASAIYMYQQFGGL